MSSVKRLLDAKAARREIRRRMMAFAEHAPVEVTAQMNASAAEITGMMRRLVPKRTGALAESISFGKEMPGGPSGVIGSRGKFGPNTIFVWAGNFKAYYARWVEFGTAAAQGHAATPAQPFFYPAWRAMKKNVKRDMRKAYKAVGERVFGK